MFEGERGERGERGQMLEGLGESLERVSPSMLKKFMFDFRRESQFLKYTFLNRMFHRTGQQDLVDG